MEIIFDVYSECCNAIKRGDLITKDNARDKEYHFQDWFQKRLENGKVNFDEPGRNTYPDFRLVDHAIGIEIKGLAYPGRAANFDSNSQIPSGIHNGREVYYAFGRYPKEPDDPKSYPVWDLVICHGDFLSSDHEYVHKNKSIKCFGTYGDIMIRDRKMYVVPTPFHLTSGTEREVTLITPAGCKVPDGFKLVGELVREEAAELIVAYKFDLETNELTTINKKNPNSGKKHEFLALRMNDSVGPEVSMKNI